MYQAIYIENEREREREREREISARGITKLHMKK
jgi:hypothetical protein